MPYYYSSTPTTTSKQSTSRHISLTLQDLDTSIVSNNNDESVDNKEDTYHDNKNIVKNVNNLQESYQQCDQYNKNYQNNINILMKKSNGSKYEEMIKKYLQEKPDFQFHMNQSRQSQQQQEQVQGQEDEQEEQEDEKNKNDISLVESSNKYVKRAINRQSKSALLRRSQEVTTSSMLQEAITEVLAKPLERNKYVPREHNGPTNLLGRQRAPPREIRERSPVTSCSKYKKSSMSNKSIVGNLPESNPKSVSVSIEEFNEWIENNKIWEKRVHDKKQKKVIEKEMKDSMQIRSPQLPSKVDYHAERSYIRNHSRGRSSSPCFTEIVSRGSSLETQRNNVMEETKDVSMMKLHELDVSQDQDDVEATDFDNQCDSTPKYEKNVFQRLYESGKRLNELNETMETLRDGGKLLSRDVSSKCTWIFSLLQYIIICKINMCFASHR